MIKKLSLIMMVVLVGTIIGGCSSKKAHKEVETPTDGAGIETKTEENESGGIEVDKNLFSVEIIIPPGIAGDQSDFNKENYLNENEGFLDAEVTSDGSLKIKMTPKKHKEMVSGMKTDMEAGFSELINGKDTPYIKDFASKKDYENALDFTPLMVGISVAMYQAIKGEEFDCNIKIVDNATKDLISDINYPEDFQK